MSNGFGIAIAAAMVATAFIQPALVQTAFGQASDISDIVPRIGVNVRSVDEQIRNRYQLPGNISSGAVVVRSRPILTPVQKDLNRAM
jgi:hypothetical protein